MWYTPSWRNAQNATTTYAEYENVAEPAASPSRPSVKLTAFVAPTMSNTAHTAQIHGDRWIPVEPDRVKDRSVLTLACTTASHANSPATMSKPANLVLFFSPRFRAFLTLIQSS